MTIGFELSMGSTADTFPMDMGQLRGRHGRLKLYFKTRGSSSSVQFARNYDCMDLEEPDLDVLV